MSDEIRARALMALSGVWDPELAVDIVSLGLVYSVNFDPDDGLEIEMTLTTPGCPVSDSLPAEARAAVSQELPTLPVRVEIIWDPPWTPDRMSDEAAQMLGFGRR